MNFPSFLTGVGNLWLKRGERFFIARMILPHVFVSVGVDEQGHVHIECDEYAQIHIKRRETKDDTQKDD